MCYNDKKYYVFMYNSLDIWAGDLRSGMENSGRSVRAMRVVNKAVFAMQAADSAAKLMMILDQAVEEVRGFYKNGERDFLILEEELNMAAFKVSEKLHFRERINAELFDYTEDEIVEMEGLSDRGKIKEGVVVFCNAIKLMEGSNDFDQIVAVYDQAMLKLENIYSEGGEEFRDLAIWRSLLALRRKTCLDSIR